MSSDNAIKSSSPEPELGVVNLFEQEWYESEDKAIARQLISPENSKAQDLSIAEIRVPAGVSIVPHHHLMEEVYHVVSGTGKMMIEDKFAQLKAGDSVAILPHQWHNIENNGSEDLMLIVTCTPAWKPELLEFTRIVAPGQ